MRALRLLAVLSFGFLTVASAAAAPAGTPGLAKEDFKQPLSKKFLRETGPKLSTKRFKEKLESSLPAAGGDKVMFQREYPGAHWRLMKMLSRGRLPGGTAVVPGDSHFDNQGFVKGVDRLVVNDLDDSGRGPVAGDAARYFGISRGSFGKKLNRRLIAQYVKTIEDPSAAKTVPKGLLPDWNEVSARELKAMTKGNDFDYKSNPNLSPVRDAKLTSEIGAMIGENPALGEVTIKAVAKLTRNKGGSSGEDRIEVYGQRGNEPVLYELKPTPAPEIEQYQARNQLSTDKRPSVLKKTFWGKDVKGNFVYVKVAGKRWLLRNRLEMASLDVTKLSKSDREKVLLAQVSNLALIHREGWRGVDPAEIKGWLRKTSKTEAGYWGDAYTKLENEK